MICPTALCLYIVSRGTKQQIPSTRCAAYTRVAGNKNPRRRLHANNKNIQTSARRNWNSNAASSFWIHTHNSAREMHYCMRTLLERGASLARRESARRRIIWVFIAAAEIYSFEALGSHACIITSESRLPQSIHRQSSSGCSQESVGCWILPALCIWDEHSRPSMRTIEFIFSNI